MITTLQRITSSDTQPAIHLRSERFYRVQRRLNWLLLYGILIFWVTLLMLPVIWLLVSSFKTDAELISYPPRFFPKVWRFSNYVDVIAKYRFLTYAGRTIYLATMFMVTNVASCSLAGYAFARIQAPGRAYLFILMLASIMVPGIVTLIPQFVLYTRMKIINTYWPWFLWGLAGNGYQIFLFRQFFASFPVELEDAAAVDGCSPFRTYWQIFLPNAKPVLAVTGLFAFQWVWGDYFNQALLLTERKATLAMKLANAFVDPRGNPLVTITIAAIVIYVLPMIIVYFLGQRQIVEGIVTTGVK